MRLYSSTLKRMPIWTTRKILVENEGKAGAQRDAGEWADLGSAAKGGKVDAGRSLPAEERSGAESTTKKTPRRGRAGRRKNRAGRRNPNGESPASAE
jgi:hypothetical protein